MSEMNISLEDMKSCIQEWFAQAIEAEDLKEIYYAVRSEADIQHDYMFEMIAKKKYEDE